MKRIYFACSIRGGRDEVDTYAKLVSFLSKHCILLSEIFADKKLTAKGMNKPSHEIWKTDTDWVKSCDAVIVEVTQPSLGVGYEIALAETLQKPILALYRDTSPEKKLSAMIDGAPGVTVVRYTDTEEAKDAALQFLKNL